jgi:hypothetical protein
MFSIIWYLHFLTSKKINILFHILFQNFTYFIFFQGATYNVFDEDIEDREMEEMLENLRWFSEEIHQQLSRLSNWNIFLTSLVQAIVFDLVWNQDRQISITKLILVNTVGLLSLILINRVYQHLGWR